MKRLVICCDGTWNRADQQKEGTLCPTNVVKLAYRVAKRDPDGVSQIVFYDQGVGTGNVLDRFTGGALGGGLSDNIFDAYRFLLANFEPGDEIYLFGFSRGAYTARSLGGMIRKCGVLDRRHVGLYVDALELYQDPGSHPDDDEPTRFRADYSCCGSESIPIRCIGVWDTVGALGIPLTGLRGLTRRKQDFHDCELSGTVEYAFHALAIDERRGPFEPTLWIEKPKPGQLVSQTWFPGVHSDVGGGYVDNGLSDITLQWMMDNTELAGLYFDPEVVAARPLEGDATAKAHDSRVGWYRLAPRHERTIDPDRSQTLHPSAIRRWDENPSYRPSNLREYFRAVGDSRGR
jgi:uncharacterized protein (DUF2235 family)